MNLLKPNATDSTNSTLRELNRKDDLEDWTVIWAEHQLKGRGQQGSSWHAEKGKNLTFSILYRPLALKVHHQFLLNCAISIGIFKALKKVGVPRLKIKWPNDIMSGSMKLGGILVENSVLKNKISNSIIGIGLNVNQGDFPTDLPNAVSLRQLLQKEFDRESLLLEIVKAIEEETALIDGPSRSSLVTTYENLLFKRNQVHMFRDLKGNEFPGQILGVTDTGLLKMEKEDESVEFYGFKEITYL